MSMTVARVMHSETKKFRQRNAGETEVKRNMCEESNMKAFAMMMFMGGTSKRDG